MSILDFKLSENESYVERAYYYSPCIEHEATREEVLLWRRVKELEAIIQLLYPPVVNEMIAAILKGVDQAWVNVESMKLLKRHALDVIRLENIPSRGEIWGSIQVMCEIYGMEEPHTIWLACDPSLPDGVVSTEKSSNYQSQASETLRSRVDLPVVELDSVL